MISSDNIEYLFTKEGSTPALAYKVITYVHVIYVENIVQQFVLSNMSEGLLPWQHQHLSSKNADIFKTWI